MIATTSKRNLFFSMFFKNKGYSRSQSLKAFYKACKVPRVKPACADPISMVYLLYMQGTANRIAHILRNINVSSSFKPLNTIENSLRFVKDPIDPKDTKGVYLVRCSCGIPYIGETCRSIKQRIKEHVADIKHSWSCISALAEHSDKSKRHVCIEVSKVVARVDHFHHKKLREQSKSKGMPVTLIGMMGGN